MSRIDDRRLHPEQAPERLVEQRTEVARLLAEADVQYARGLDESRAWRALQAKRAVQPRRLRWVPVGVGLVGAAAVLLWLFRPAPIENGTRVATPAAPAKPIAAPQPVSPVPPAEPTRPRDLVAETETPPSAPQGRRPKPPAERRTLRAGRSVLADGSEIRLAPRGVAAIRANPERGTTIELLSGVIDLKVAPQGSGTFEVAAANITFRVVGTRFRVSLQGQEPKLEVSEGTVAVVEDGRIVVRVTAGGWWNADAPARAEEPPSEQPRPATVEQPRPAAIEQPRPAAIEQPRPAAAAPNPEPCLAMARQGQTREALRCLQPISRGSGLSAEMAIYEISRLQRDVLGDGPAALATLQGYATRFPDGALHAEAQLSRISLLARLGHTQEALAESGRLLSGAGGRERGAELHLLRGDLMRERLGDCDGAIKEYALAEADRRGSGAEATLGHARCFENQGRKTEAAALYRACIERGQGRTASEARRRLEAIER
jgi:ferric-dicitrate binding protein FerR (iron transport regulator)